MEIDGMAEKLTAVAGNGGKRADGDLVGGVDVVVLGDGGVSPENQL